VTVETYISMRRCLCRFAFVTTTCATASSLVGGEDGGYRGDRGDSAFTKAIQWPGFSRKLVSILPEKCLNLSMPLPKFRQLFCRNIGPFFCTLTTGRYDKAIMTMAVQNEQLNTAAMLKHMSRLRVITTLVVVELFHVACEALFFLFSFRKDALIFRCQRSRSTTWLSSVGTFCTSLEPYNSLRSLLLVVSPWSGLSGHIFLPVAVLEGSENVPADIEG
jgi:hypothetical protein